MSNNDHDLDHDPVWDLVDRAQPSEAGPLFSRNVMREIRLAEHSPAPWWKRLLSSKPLVASGLAGATAVALLLSIDPTGPAGQTDLTGATSPEPAALAELNEELDQELLKAAAEDPSLFSDEQLLAILY